MSLELVFAARAWTSKVPVFGYNLTHTAPDPFGSFYRW